jgi:hypothetical protein
MKYKIQWRYVSALEEPRTSIVQAKDKQAAIAKLKRDHLDPDSRLRSDLKVLKLEAA